MAAHTCLLVAGQPETGAYQNARRIGAGRTDGEGAAEAPSATGRPAAGRLGEQRLMVLVNQCLGGEERRHAGTVADH